ncbi:MAG: hypothetical protein KAS32_01385, partial [Candidatus Peribacteraceae bacterium]|nr:hypothetical protein [Candidatus Peribacteraceae bacterium]
DNKMRLYANVQSTAPSLEISEALKIPSPEKRQPDLQYITAVFVSSGYNLNSAYFLPTELYKSRGTIAEKPLDIEHDQVKIVGHLYSSIFTYKDGSVFDPNELHETVGSDMDKVSMDIVSAMRLYKARFPELAEEVNEGKYKVSMECFYKDFDIIVDNIIIPKLEAKSLGLVEVVNNIITVVEGADKKGKHRVGRVLRGMLFSGCGLVENPANPDSIILETAANQNDKYILDLTKVGSYMKAKQEDESVVIHSLEGTEKTQAYVSASFGGSHRHDISTDKPETFSDGTHNHLVWPDSIPEEYSSIYFVGDGEHRHEFNTKTGKLGQENDHVHKVYVEKKDGGYSAVESSQPKSKHTHEFTGVDIEEKYDRQTDKYVTKKVSSMGETSYGGSHYHEIELEEGNKIKTILPSDILKMESSVKEEEGSWVDGRPLSTPEICVSFKRYVYTKGGDNPGEPANADKTPGVIPQVESLPAPTGGGAGDTITQDDVLIHTNWCALFDTECNTPGGIAVHPECLRLILDRTTKDVVSNYFEKLQENRKSVGVGKSLSSLNKILEEVKLVTDIKEG